MGDGLGDLAFWLAVGFGALGFFFGPIGRALGRRLEGRKATAVDEQRMHELEARVAELEQSQARLAEVEERLDFNERLLSQQRDAARLGEGNR